MRMINNINKRIKYQLFWKYQKKTNTSFKYFETTCPIDIELSFCLKDFKPFKQDKEFPIRGRKPEGRGCE